MTLFSSSRTQPAAAITTVERRSRHNAIPYVEVAKWSSLNNYDEGCDGRALHVEWFGCVFQIVIAPQSRRARLKGMTLASTSPSGAVPTSAKATS